MSSLGITLVTELARRGAQIIAVVPDASDPACQSLVDLVRHTTNNELVYAEQCDLSSPDNIKDFCAKLVKSSGGGLENEPPRLDAVVFAHEYPHIGVFKGTADEKRTETRRRLEGRLATFFFTTLLLPVLLTAPQERDIRFINIVSPFYGAAIPSFKMEGSEQTSSGSIWIDEGRRSLQSILFTRHFQRILDALPSPSVKTHIDGSQQRSASNTATDNKNDEEAVASKRPSNIVAVAVSPGISRWDTVAPFMRASRASSFFSPFGLLW
jgi:NAD(P)-dependent dehydrogenase (short-subunit alcohol dehydrogenase family)